MESIQKNISTMKMNISLSASTGEIHDCIFCRIVDGDEDGTFIYRTTKVSAFLDIHPLFEGHTLIVPNVHFADITDVPEEYIAEIARVTKIVSNMMIKSLGAEGINVMHSTGRPAGQTIFHFHVHVLPRRNGDDDGFQRWWFSRSHRATRQELDSLAEKMLR
jgi:histidine triad (HIT) family protein